MNKIVAIVFIIVGLNFLVNKFVIKKNSAEITSNSNATTQTTSGPENSSAKNPVVEETKPAWKDALEALRSVSEVSVPIDSAKTMLALQAEQIKQVQSGAGADELNVKQLRPAFKYEQIVKNGKQILARPAFIGSMDGAYMEKDSPLKVSTGASGMQMTISLMQFLHSAVDDPKAELITFNHGKSGTFNAELTKDETLSLIEALINSGVKDEQPIWGKSDPSETKADNAPKPNWQTTFEHLRNVKEVSVIVKRGTENSKAGQAHPDFHYQQYKKEDGKTVSARGAYSGQSGTEYLQRLLKSGEAMSDMLSMQIPILDFLQSAIDDPQADEVTINKDDTGADATLTKEDAQKLLEAFKAAALSNEQTK